VKTILCTLFDNDYHLGAAALFNSAVHQGFKGLLVAGYRGALPPWAEHASPTPAAFGLEAKTLAVAEGVTLLLVRLDTDMHLTNYKPWFMLDIFEHLAPSVLYYMDCDICIAQPWGYFDDWASCGVALCEDINSPIHRHHPKRIGWRRAFEPQGFRMEYRGPYYVNGGLVGLERKNLAFLKTWRSLTEIMFEVIGGGRVAKIQAGEAYKSKGFGECFEASDQDALNATIEACPDVPVSLLDRAAMGFQPGLPVAPHALLIDKPWRRNYLKWLSRGHPPREVDRLFWRYVDGPIRILQREAPGKRRVIQFAKGVGRFYRR